MTAILGLWDCREIITVLDFVVLGIAILAMTVAVATVLTMVTPTRTKSKMGNMILRLLNIMAGNIAKNRNMDDSP